MAMALTYFHLVPFTRDIGTPIRLMAKARFGIGAVIFMMVNLRMILHTVMVLIYIRMGRTIRGNGKRTCRRARVKKNGKMANPMKAVI